MFNLLVKSSGWADVQDSLTSGQVFEHTDQDLRERFKPQGKLDFKSLCALPTLFLKESGGQDEPVAKVGTIIRARVNGRFLDLRYTYDQEIPPITNSALVEFAPELDIEDFEFYRTHWAVKDIDLFQVLLRHSQPRRQRPKVFRIDDLEKIEPSLVSAMMPFDASFNDVYTAIKTAADEVGLRCRRVDDIWENAEIIQDVVSLIDHSNIVVCDCSTRNPNVFYEIGIAHTLGREVILIAQSKEDVPFDLRHLRFIKYLNNDEGRSKLTESLKGRMADLS